MCVCKYVWKSLQGVGGWEGGGVRKCIMNVLYSTTTSSPPGNCIPGYLT